MGLIKKAVQKYVEEEEQVIQPTMLDRELLILTVKQAQNLRDVEFFNKSDPFVEVTFKNES